MKKFIVINLLLLITFSLYSPVAYSQIFSLDLAAIRNIRTQHTGLNVSAFYHFNEKLSAGLELNRFFPHNRKLEGEELTQSAWDFDLNFHYEVPFYKKFIFYPISGISHTSEKELVKKSEYIHYERFWSFNTGIGILFKWKSVHPHIEYTYTWGKINQQFLLAGLSFELNWNRGKLESGKK